MKARLRKITKRIKEWREKIDAALKRRKQIRQEANDCSTTSAKGLEFLIREEGVVLGAYNDPAGHCTVAVGHLLHHGNCTQADYDKWGRPPNGMSRAEAIALLRQDVGKTYGATVARVIKRPCKQHEFDAMVSLCFNIGTQGFTDSTVAREFNAGNKGKAADAFLLWRNPAILIPRRKREIALFKHGNYGA